MLCSAKHSFPILYENERCFLVERPAVCPLVSSLPFSGEGFLDWFLRRFSPDSEANACRTVRLDGKELVLIPKVKGFGGAAFSNDPGWECVRVSSPDGWRVWHPW